VIGNSYFTLDARFVSSLIDSSLKICFHLSHISGTKWYAHIHTYIHAQRPQSKLFPQHVLFKNEKVTVTWTTCKVYITAL